MMLMTSHQPTKRVSRADLLRSLILVGADNLEVVAELTGYQTPPKQKIELSIIPSAVFAYSSNNIEPDHPLKSPSPIHYYRVIERQPSELLPEPNSNGAILPDWYAKIPPLDLASVQPDPIEPPAKEPLVPWPKLWPVLQALLSALKRSRQPDVPRLVRLMANAEIPVRIPRKVRQQWSATVQLLVDRPGRTELFNDDYNQLLKQLERLRGATGLEIQQLIQRPGCAVRVRQGNDYRSQPWRMPQAGSTILIIGDLGLLDRSGRALQEWLRFGERLRIAGFQPVALLPLPRRYLTPELINLFDCVCWTRHSDLRPVTWVIPKKQTELSALDQDGQGVVLNLLAWLSPAVRVEPGLLRAVRHHLSSSQNDAGIEAAAWLHEDVQATNIGFYYQPENLKKHRERFKELAAQNPELARSVVDLLRRYHRHVFPTQLHEEMLILAELMGESFADTYQTEIQAASTHWQQLLQAVNEKTAGSEGLPAYTPYYLNRQHPSMWQAADSQHLPALWGVLQRDYPQQRLDQMPDFIADSPEAIRVAMAFLNQAQGLVLDYVLFQRGMKALQASTRRRFQEGEDGFTEGSLLAKFQVASNYALQQRRREGGKLENRLLPLNDNEILEFELEENEKQQLHIAGEQLTIERLSKPDWAVSIGRSQGALTVTTQSSGKTHTWYWHSPEIGVHWESGHLSSQIYAEPTQSYSLPGFWHYLPPDAEDGLTPDWAETVVRDRRGLYADANIAGITQRFRWIQPGSFMMGSPNNEKGRYDDETRHWVNLTQGYWLADTVCTQVLWQAVMGENPSEFKDANNPVENVSWDDIKQFLQQLDRFQPELNLRLPSEAEWEYACRAETNKAFNVGDELTLADANYRGTWEYESDKWGEGALQRTAAVQSYAPNRWGLYEMHGNVWEWCQDWDGEYPSGPVIDPQGPDTGTFRVVRGGSWICGARDCRSADRGAFDPANRDDGSGFRLARGHEASPVRLGAGQQPDGRRAAVAHGAQPGDGQRAEGEASKTAKTPQ